MPPDLVRHTWGEGLFPQIPASTLGPSPTLPDTTQTGPTLPLWGTEADKTEGLLGRTGDEGE